MSGGGSLETLSGVSVGIFGDADDAQVQAVARELTALGVDHALIESSALDQGYPLSFEDGRPWYRGHDLSGLTACYVRSVPVAFPPVEERDGEWVLFDDWFTHFMHQKERASLYVAWLLALQQHGAALINGPHCGSLSQYKPFQLDILRAIGARVPRTLISNDPLAVQRFAAEVGDVIFKPVMGGAITQRLDAAHLDPEVLAQVRSAPVIFQERIEGDDLRVMLIDGAVVSSVAIDTPSQHLDFRADPIYQSGGARYREVELPPRIVTQCRKAAERCGLVFAGIDLKRRGDDFVFLELNSSPIYLDVELKLGHGISAAIARRLAASAVQVRERSARRLHRVSL